MRTYSDLAQIDDFVEKYEYLRIGGGVANETFGFERYLNQQFYKSKQWLDVRAYVITRDNGCDLGDPERPLFSDILVHHMNPMTADDIENWNPDILDPEYLITTCHDTHNAIHYGDESLLYIFPPAREAGDTTLW